MQTLDLTQGSDAWHNFRTKHYTASMAPIMMGVHPSATRNDLLRVMYSGDEREISRYVREVVFERGHEAEAAVRPFAEGEIGEELFPTTVVDDDDFLSASLDGITMDESVIWENKQFSQKKVDHIAEHQTCPPEDYWQVVQQLMITGAERCLYTVGNDPDNVAKVWVEPDQGVFATLLAGWHQFQDDLKDYEPPEDEPVTVGHTMESLPALHIEVTGEVTASNLAQYKSHALAVFESINTDLQTDQDFADAESAVKWCKDVEDRLDAAKQHALSQTASIDDLFRTIDDTKESARQKRLALDKLVKQRKTGIRDEIRRNAENTLSEHVKKLEARLDNRVRLPAPTADFADAMKNKRTIASLRDSVDQVLANAKIEANETADTIEANLKAFDQTAGDYQSLFPDLQSIVQKAPDDFKATVKLRISEHKEAEEKRMEAERERIRAEEQEKIEAERQADQRRADAEEQRRSNEDHEKAVETEQPEKEATTAPDKGKHGNVTWDVVFTMEIQSDSKTTAESICSHARDMLKKAGIAGVYSVEAVRKSEAA